MLLGTLGGSSLGKMLAGKGTNRAGDGIIRAACGSKGSSKMLPHPLTNFEIQRYYQNESRFNGVYSRNKIKDGTYVINLDEYDV